MELHTPSLRGASATRQSSLSYKWIASSPTAPRNDGRVLALARMTALKNQKGNALWFILVAIGLLGLLTVVLSRSGSSTNETGSFERNVIQANEILSYAKNVKNAVQSLLARGCSENDLSFWHDSNDDGTEDASDDYFNTINNSTIPNDHDSSCYIFDVAGAGMTWNTRYEELIFASLTNITNLRTTRDDLILMINEIDQNTCEALNNVIFSDTTITENPATFDDTPQASGSYDTGTSEINLTSFTPHDGQESACFSFDDAGTVTFHFYHTLHAR